MTSKQQQKICIIIVEVDKIVLLQLKENNCICIYDYVIALDTPCGTNRIIPHIIKIDVEADKF